MAELIDGLLRWPFPSAEQGAWASPERLGQRPSCRCRAGLTAGLASRLKDVGIGDS
jgi:hypothetical protein